MWISTDDCRCQEHVRHMRSPKWSYAQRSTSSALIASTSGSWSAGAVAKQHLLERVAAQAEPQRLERDHFFGRDVAEVDRGPERLDEPRLGGLRRRLEDDVHRTDSHRDLTDQLRPHAAGGVEDPGGTAFPRLGDHLPGPRVQFLLKPLDPLLGCVVDRRVLRADLGEHREIASEVGNQLELSLAGDCDRSVRDLDVLEPKPLQPHLVVLELSLCVQNLEVRPANDDGFLTEHFELPLEVLSYRRRAPPELDDRDVVPGDLEDVLPCARP